MPPPGEEPLPSALQIPKEWNTLKRARANGGTGTGAGSTGAKTRDTVKKRFKSETAVSNNSADSIEDICRSMCDNISRCEDVEHELDFSDVLSHIDYRSVLEGLFGGRGLMGCDVPVVTKVFEESFMREPMTGERKCVMGTSCEAMLIDKSKPFIAVEFQGDTGLMHRGDPAVRGVVRRARRVPQGLVSGDAATRPGALHAIPVSGIPALPLHSADALHVALHLPVRQPAFSGASGNVICPLQRVRLRPVCRLDGLQAREAWGAVLGGEDHDPANPFSSQIEQLHERLKEDYTTRWELDTYLLALHYRNHSRWMVLDLSDTYHYYNLPDLMPVIRGTLVGLCCTAWLQKLFNIFLCGKRYRRLTNAVQDSVQLTAAVINTLHGLLLGLYPFNERRSDMQRRAFIAGSLHCVLVSGQHAAFIATHPNLLCLGLIEYILNVVHDFCPVEWTLLGVTTGSKSQCLATIESFRETSVNRTSMDYAASFFSQLETDATPVVSVLVRFFRDASLYQHRPRGILPVAMLQHLPLASETRMIQNSSSIFGQLKCALPDIQFDQSESLEEIWTSIYMRQLPSHTALKQMQLLRTQGGMCHLVEHELHHFPVCLACALTRRTDVLKTLFRYDAIDRRLICDECLSHRHVVHINMLGRVLYVRDKVIVLCDQCLRPTHWDAPCIGCEAGSSASSDPIGCCVCCNTNVASSKEIIDVKRFRIQAVHFCYKHSLSCVLSKATVYDVHSMEQELHAGRNKRH